MELRTIIGDNIRCFRNRLGWSQEFLGEKSGISRDYIGRIERGEVNLGMNHIQRISGALSVSPHYLLQKDYCFGLAGSEKEVPLTPVEETEQERSTDES